MRETWTLAVFSEMKSDSPISRFVWPSATSARTVSSRVGEPEAVDVGSSAAASGAASSARGRAGRAP